MATLVHKLIGALASFWLACGVLFMLFLLTWLGTLAQIDSGLHDVQNRYFNSLLVIHHQQVPLIGHVAIPLIGGYALMAILFVNLVVGGLIRLRKSKRTIGILVAHVGILLMLVAGFVKFTMSDDGQLALYEGESGDRYASDYDWEVALTRDLGNGQFEEFVIPGHEFTDIGRNETRTFQNEALPFDLELRDFMVNSRPRSDGRALREVAPEIEHAEQNLAGIYAALRPKDGSPRQEGILWGWSGNSSTTSWSPMVLEVGGTAWATELRHVRYQLPFTIHLDKFTATFHPRTDEPASFESEVTKIEGDVLQPVVIRMNEPLRHGDFILFQSGYGPPGAGPGDRMYSSFSVARNPSDQWPLWSCGIIAVGLLLHFSQKLFGYIRAETKRTA